MLHEEQFYLYDQIQTSQTGGQPYLHPLVSVVWLDCQFFFFFFFFSYWERERNPHNINYASEFPTLEEIAEVNLSGVQRISLALEVPPSWSR